MVTPDSMRILIATDAWDPQVNGVVRTLKATGRELTARGHEVRYVTPDGFTTVPLPTYPEVRLALFAKTRIAGLISTFAPDAIHIATEGPIGLATRQVCVERGLPFTTSFHTRFPEYIEARTALPSSWTYGLIRWFHQPASRTMVSTASLQSELRAKGFSNLCMWSRGVDTNLFRPGAKSLYDLPRPVSLYVGRVAVEKNLEAFLSLDLPGTKVVVGDGPQLAELKARFPDVRFAGARFGADLAAHYAASDVFVFPSRTDTFGLVMLEALACGVPVAAFPVQGPLDVLGCEAGVGAMSENLKSAIEQALHASPSRCRSYALEYSWQACTDQFLANLTTPVVQRPERVHVAVAAHQIRPAA
jgi:glycosyltransferase involved in cell wall biosynthesis